MLDPRLRALLPPPEHPSAYDVALRPTIERTLGTALPTDYVDFAQTYGPGAIDGEIAIFAPGDLAEARNTKVDEFTELAPGSIGHAATRFFPQPGGLLPWAADRSGNWWHWVTIGPPDDWTIVVEEAGTFPLELHRYDLSLTRYLAAFLANELTDPVSRAWGRGPHTWVAR